MGRHETDQGGADEERGVPEADHERETPTADDVPGKPVDLRRHEPDAETDAETDARHQPPRIAASPLVKAVSR